MVPPEERGTRRTYGAPGRRLTRMSRHAFPPRFRAPLPRLRLRRTASDRLSNSRGRVGLADESPARRRSSWQTGDANGTDHRRFGRAAAARAGAWTVRHARNRVAGRDVDCAAALLLPARWIWACRRGAAFAPHAFWRRVDQLL